jgi:hypothetical protein
MNLKLEGADILCEHCELALRSTGSKAGDHQKQADRRVDGTARGYGSVRRTHPVILLQGQDANTERRLRSSSPPDCPDRERPTGSDNGQGLFRHLSF